MTKKMKATGMCSAATFLFAIARRANELSVQQSSKRAEALSAGSALLDMLDNCVASVMQFSTYGSTLEQVCTAV